MMNRLYIKMNSSKNYKSNIQCLSYYCAYALYFFINCIAHTTFLGVSDSLKGIFCDIVQIFILIFLVFKYLSQKAVPSVWAASLSVVLIGFLSWRYAHEGWLFWLVLFVICSEDVDITIVAFISLVLNAVMIAVTLTCSYFGIIQNLVFVRNGVLRHAGGFTHPNSLGLYLLLACVTLSTLRFRKGSLLPDIALVVTTTAINIGVADSRTSAVLSSIMLALLLAFRLARSSWSQKLLSCACVIVVAATMVGSYYFMVAYDPGNPVHAILNSVLSGRLRLANAYYRMQPLTLFGSDFSRFSPIAWDGGQPNPFLVDNAFCHLLLRYGVVPTALFMVGLFGLLAKLVHERRCDVLLFGITLMMVYGVTETMGIRVECDFFLVAMGSELLFGGSQAAANSLASTRYRQPTGLEASR